eukprot:11472923-Heterocapsa_arctica.AAC.1
MGGGRDLQPQPARLRKDDEDILACASDADGPGGANGHPDGFPRLQLSVPGEKIFPRWAVSLFPAGGCNGVVA